MGKSYVLVEVEDTELQGTTVLGDKEVGVILIDWGNADDDPDYASDLLEEIDNARNAAGGPAPQALAGILTRLQGIVDAAEEEEEEEEDDEELCDACNVPISCCVCDDEDEDDEEEDDE